MNNGPRGLCIDEEVAEDEGVGVGDKIDCRRTIQLEAHTEERERSMHKDE